MRCFLFLLALLLPVAGQTTYTISTAAGSDWVGDQGPAANAILRQAEGLTSDLSGNLYVADAVGHRIREISAAGIIRTVAGTGIGGFSGDGGPATQAQVDSPYGILLDPRGNLFIADLGNSRVRRITPDGSITTVAGGGSLPAGGVNEGSSATVLALNAPRNLAMDSAGNLYISDFGAHRVYRLDPGGSLTTVAGTGVAGFGGDGGVAYSAQLAYPAALAVDSLNNLYIADSGNHLIRKVAHGLISSYARAATPTGLALDPKGTLYIADASGGQILVIPMSGKSSALPLAAQDVALSADGSLYLSTGTMVLRLTMQGAVTLAAGGGDTAHGDQAKAILALLNHPAGVAVDALALGNLYIADRDNNRIRRVSPTGIITTVAGTGVPGNSGDGLQATLATLNGPTGVSVDASGVVYITDTGNHRVRKIALDGTMQAVLSVELLSPTYTLPGLTGDLYIADSGLGAILHLVGETLSTVKNGLKGPRGLALDNQGNLYFTEMDAARVSRLGPGPGADGSVVQIAEGLWNIPRGVVADNSGGVFVADTGLQQIVHVDSSGRTSVMAGTGMPGFSGDGGPAAMAELGFPWDIAPGAAGVLYFADLDNNRIRALTPAQQPIVAQISLLGLVNAASQLTGPIAPGMLVAISGTGLNASQLSTTQVMFGSAAGTFLSVSGTQLLVQVPAQLADGLVDINVLSQGISLGVVPSVAVVDAAPALFADSSGQAAATNEDGTLNSAANPAARGSIVVLYGTGLGVVAQPVSVQISGNAADVLYAGAVAAYPGLFQVNARVPAGYLNPGIVSVSVSVGQAGSQAGVTVAIN
jgi:uncharacterized protein (TIGR03437 family)